MDTGSPTVEPLEIAPETVILPAPVNSRVRPVALADKFPARVKVPEFEAMVVPPAPLARLMRR